MTHTESTTTQLKIQVSNPMAMSTSITPSSAAVRISVPLAEMCGHMFGSPAAYPHDADVFAGSAVDVRVGSPASGVRRVEAALCDDPGVTSTRGEAHAVERTAHVFADRAIALIRLHRQ